eukprot:CAMPEP_0182493654 /NCGR_PEP_ID=MMETSP1321-20130603/2585_1 /TAXON_ID=91990 /ORGANISM="Bolidomonas sp., Strain RCC1657" /LENGTH=34 /DNA_ID= /DNA_START= /DNA_END= /DNA_ORIENTATION=
MTVMNAMRAIKLLASSDDFLANTLAFLLGLEGSL